VGRTKTRVVSGGSLSASETTQYTFDAHRLASECQLSSGCDTSLPSKSYIYDDFGRVDMVGTALDNQLYFQSTTYDEYGRVFQQFDAAGSSQGIRHHYNARGYAYKQVEARNSADPDATVYYEAKEMDAFGNVTEFTQNNGLVTSYKTYDPLTGYVSDIQADNGFLIQDNHYVFDAIGNLRTRTRNSLQSTYDKSNETFEYDTLNRLTDINGVEQVRYQANGNIDWKFDVNNGAASYYCYRTARHHAVSGLGANGCSTDDYQYDDNGNMTSGRGRAITYGHFDKPTLITNSAGTTSFAYDLSRNRYKRETTENGETTLTYYIGNVEVVFKDGAFSETRRYLSGAIQTQYSTAAIKTRYLHKDHLGSIDSMTDDSGKLVEKLYFDAWGKKESVDISQWDINAAFIATTLTNITSVTPRGFTGHEHIEHADIIHMNGRIYDPTLGRFLQADPHIQAPKNSQSLNRYSYVLNNPLSYTDPSGYFWNKIKKFAGVIVGAILIAATNGLASPFVTSFWGAVSLGGIVGGVGAAVNGGNILKGALTGAFSAAAFYGVGTAFAGGDFGSAGYFSKVAAHGTVGGVMSVLQGGKFGHGFAAAGVTQAFSKAIGSIGGKINGAASAAWSDAGNRIRRVIAAAVVGGTASAVSGGKFANGAVTGAFSRAFNDELHDQAEEKSFWESSWNNIKDGLYDTYSSGTYFLGVGLDAIPGTGFTSSIGFMFNTESLLDSGIYLSGGKAWGIEGSLYGELGFCTCATTYDVYGMVPTVSIAGPLAGIDLSADMANAPYMMQIGGGIPIGASYSEPFTYPITPRVVVDGFNEIYDRLFE
jgi:RHS repeat-associated protein